MPMHFVFSTCVPFACVCLSIPPPPQTAFVNVGLAVGLSIAGFVVFVALPIIICVVICCCLGVCASAAGGGGRTRVVTHMAPSHGGNTTIVSNNTSNMMQVCFLSPDDYTVEPLCKDTPELRTPP